MKPWLRKSLLCGASVAALALLVILAVAGTFLVQRSLERPEERSLAQRIDAVPGRGTGGSTEAGSDRPPVEPVPGTVVLSLSSAAVIVEAGPAGEPIRVESSFDPGVYRMEQEYTRGDAGRWVYHLDFHETRLLHVSVFGVWIGRRSPVVRVVLPRDLSFALEARMRGGYLTLDLAGLALTAADVELDRGVLDLDVSAPLERPLERLRLVGRTGTMRLGSLGNASPQSLTVRHGIGLASVDLRGAWLRDADVDFAVALGRGWLALPRDVRIERIEPGLSRLAGIAEEETPRPTLRVHTHFDLGDIQVVE